MADLHIVEGTVDETEEIDIQELLQETLDGVQQSRDAKSREAFFKSQDQKLAHIGIRVGDSEALDPDIYLANPLLAGLWILGQFREIAEDIENLGIVSYLSLITAWEEFAEHILEME